MKTIELIRAEVETTADSVRITGYEETSNEMVLVIVPRGAIQPPPAKKKEAKDG